MDNQMEVINVSFMQLNNVFNAFFVIYLPLINASMEESTNVIEKNDALKSLLSTIRQLFHALYDLLVLTATCAQSNLPRARVEPILYPEFVGSYFPGRDFYNQLLRCKHLMWSLTGESVESFNQIVRDVTPYVTMYTQRRRLRVFIWLRMYPEVTMLSGLFMMSPTTVQREIRFLLPVLSNYFKEQVYSGQRQSNGWKWLIIGRCF